MGTHFFHGESIAGITVVTSPFTFIMSLDNMPYLARLVAASLAVTEKSAKLVQEIFKHGNLKIEDKGGLKNYQTEADRKIEQLLVGNISDDSYWIDYEKALKSLPEISACPDVDPKD